MRVVKKDGTIEEYQEQKIIDACNKAARRAMVELSNQDYEKILNDVWEEIEAAGSGTWDFCAGTDALRTAGEGGAGNSVYSEGGGRNAAERR